MVGWEVMAKVEMEESSFFIFVLAEFLVANMKYVWVKLNVIWFYNPTLQSPVVFRLSRDGVFLVIKFQGKKNPSLKSPTLVSKSAIF